MAVHKSRPFRRIAWATLSAAACSACSAGHSVAATSRPVAPPVATAPASTSATTTTAPTGTTGTTADTTTVSAPAPPYPVATVTLPLVDRSRATVSHGRTISPSRALTTTVWFPNRPGRWPLVVFAHGFDVSPQPYTSLLSSWAAHGYVVAAPAFPLTDPAVAGPNLDEADIDNQPADVRFVTDELSSPAGPLSSRIDRTRVAVAGHSDGAETALAASTDPVPAGQPVYRAVLVLSGQPVPGAAGHNPPALIVQGDADTINPPPLGYAAWNQAASPKYLLVLEGAGHLPPYETGSSWLAGVEAVTEGFLDAYVAGDGPASSVRARAAAYAGMTIETG